MRSITIIVCAMLIAGCCSAAVQIENADFSAGPPAVAPPGWDASHADDTMTVDDADGHPAPPCLRYSAEDQAPWRYLTQVISLEPQTDYVLSASFKFSGAVRPTVGIREPGAPRMTFSINGGAADGWLRQQTRFNSGALPQVELIVYGDRGPGDNSRPGEARIDSIRIDVASDLAASAPIVGGYAGPPPGENLALGKSYSWSAKPSYPLSMDDADIVQLTDGEFTAGYFWAQKTTVGWKVRKPLSVVIDLEEPAPICGVSMRTAAGVASVGWPAMIFVLTSMDGENFEYQGELVSLSGEWGLPHPQRYTAHRYVTDRLEAAGRYVKLVVCPGSQFIFADEIEVFRGDFSIGDVEPGEPVESDASMVADHRLQGIVGVRLMYDLQDMRAVLAASEITAARKSPIAAALDALETEALGTEFEPVDHWRGLPYNDLEARIWAINSQIRQAEGLPELTLWQSPRWDMLDPFAPPTGTGAAVTMPIMNGEYRSAAFNLTNYGDRARNARISVDLGDVDPSVVTVQEVQYVQTQDRQIVANALPVADLDADGRARMAVPAGATRQVWLTVHPVDVAPGTHTGQITVEIGGEQMSVPITLDVAPMDMIEPPLSVFCWDYIGDTVSYAPNFVDPDAMAVNLADHFVDAPWLQAGWMPWPQEGEIDAAGHITAPMDFSALDRWMARFPRARLYCMYMSYHSMRNALAVNSERWKVAMGEWATAVVEHLREKGIETDRWCVLPVDEPGEAKREQLAIDVSNALHATQPELQIFEDPTRKDPENAIPELYEVSAILCPNLPRIVAPFEKAGEYYSALARDGKRLFVYQCSGPHKLLDPHTYHRLEAWHAWNLGATGVGYWGYVDSKPTGSSWDNFKCGGTSYSLVYADDIHLADSKQWEAVREGVIDYTYLAMLRDAVNANAGEDTPAVRHARELLETLPGEVAGTLSSGAYRWVDQRDRTAADTARDQILQALIDLNE